MRQGRRVRLARVRGERVDALPSTRAAEARKRPKQIRLERDAKRRGKDGVRLAREKKSDALVSARALAEEGAGLFLKPLDTSKLRRDAKRLGGGANATNKSWFSMPAVEYTPELRRDMRLLKLRGAYDPKRFYKTDDTSKLPKNFQIGTVVEGAQDFYAARLTRKERSRSKSPLRSPLRQVNAGDDRAWEPPSKQTSSALETADLAKLHKGKQAYLDRLVRKANF